MALWLEQKQGTNWDSTVAQVSLAVCCGSGWHWLVCFICLNTPALQKKSVKSGHIQWIHLIHVFIIFIIIAYIYIYVKYK